MTVKRCPSCGGLWTIESERRNKCMICQKYLQNWAELREASDWVKIYKNAGQYGI